MKPCKAFAQMSASEFAEKFCGTIKAADEAIPTYTRIVAAFVSEHSNHFLVIWVLCFYRESFRGRWGKKQE